MNIIFKNPNEQRIFESCNSIPDKLEPLPDDDDTFIPAKNLPKYIGIPEPVLRRWRYEERGPKFVVMPWGPDCHTVEYRSGDVREWLADADKLPSPRAIEDYPNPDPGEE